MADFLRNLGINFGQLALIGGGFFTAVILPMIYPVGKGSGPAFFHMAGIGMMAAGGAWYMVDKSKAVTSMAVVNTVPIALPDEVQTGLYAPPRNNLSAVKPQNRFDKMSNFVLDKNNSSFDDYINNIILTESKAAGLDLLDKSNYPVKVNPWEMATLNPTAAVTPIKDFNTVKMIA